MSAGRIYWVCLALDIVPHQLLGRPVKPGDDKVGPVDFDSAAHCNLCYALHQPIRDVRIVESTISAARTLGD